MASETVALDHPSTPEPVEKEVGEEVKTMEQEGVSLPTESKEKPKDEKPPSPAAAQAELIEKIEEKPSEPPAIEEVTKTNEEEKPKVEDSPAVEEVTKADVEEQPKANDSPNETVSSAEPEEKVEDKHTEASDIQKPDDTPVVDASPKDNPESEREEISNVAEQVADNVESKPEEQIEIKSSEKPTEESPKETTEEKTEEQPKKIDVPESSVEAVEEEEGKKEKLPEKEPEAAAVKDAETSEAKHEKEETSAPIPEEEEKPVAQPAITDETGKESVAAEPKEVEVEVVKGKETSTDEFEDSKLTKEEKAIPSESSDQVTLTNKDTAVEAKDVEGAPAEAAECVESKEKESVDVVEEPVKEKIELENEAKEVKTEESALPETTVKTEEDKAEKSEALVQPEKIVETEEEKGEKTEELTKPASEVVAEVTSLAEKAEEEANESRDIEMDTENGSSKDETVPPIETNKEDQIEKKAEVPAITTGSASLGDLLKPETEAKGVENLEAVESKVEKEKVADETAKPDIGSIESTKDADENKTSEDTSKEEVPVKTKQSNNILLKVKRTLVKAKKAIIGKSPNSKTPSSETKDDVTA